MKAVSLTPRSLGWLNEKRLSRVMLLFAALLLLALILGLFGYLFVQDLFAFGAFPKGVKIVGVSVAGLNRTEAEEKCRAELAEVANRPLTLAIDDERYQISASDIGLMLDYGKMVDTAYREAWSVNIFERMFRRFVNRPREVNVSLLGSSDEARINEWVSVTINSINRHPRDAYVDVTSGKPVIVEAQDGRSCDLDQLLAETDAALMRADRTVKVKVGRIPARLTADDIGKFIIISLAEHRLTLYDREQPLAEFPVACGSASYPTPVGQWKITGKQRNPSWYNPGTPWATGMPKVIPPGPGNPLGTRALPLNASGVLIHGTPSPWSIGQSVSHGCVRMYMRDIEQLFEMVEVDMPVYVIRAPGNPGFDPSQKPFWKK